MNAGCQALNIGIWTALNGPATDGEMKPAARTFPVPQPQFHSLPLCDPSCLLLPPPFPPQNQPKKTGAARVKSPPSAGGAVLLSEGSVLARPAPAPAAPFPPAGPESPAARGHCEHASSGPAWQAQLEGESTDSRPRCRAGACRPDPPGRSLLPSTVPPCPTGPAVGRRPVPCRVGSPVNPGGRRRQVHGGSDSLPFYSGKRG